MTWPDTYIEKIAQQVYIETLPTGEECTCWPAGEDALWLGYAVLALARGEQTTSQDVHDSWSSWAVQHYDFVHRSVVPFGELAPEIQAYDDEYRDAIHRVAQRIGEAS